MTAMVHDMLLTPNYAIVIDGSVRTDGSRLISGKGMTFFNQERPLRFGVITRSNASPENIKWIVADSPGHVWHTISAWENEDEVVIQFPVIFTASYS